MLRSLEQRRWLPEEPYELSESFPAAPVSSAARRNPLSALRPQTQLGQQWNWSHIYLIMLNISLCLISASDYAMHRSFVRHCSAWKVKGILLIDSTMKSRNATVKEYNKILLNKSAKNKNLHSGLLLLRVGIRAKQFGEIIKLRLFWPILRLRFNMRFLRSSFCSVLFTKKAINHSLVWPTQHWKQSTCKRLFPLGQADVFRLIYITSLFNYWIVKEK